LAHVDLPEPGDGEVQVQNLWLSVDPYMRGRMNAGESYVPPFELNQPMAGGAVGRVIRSRSPDLPEGSLVLSNKGWRDSFVSAPAGLELIADDTVPAQAFLGVLGMPGMTAWAGLNPVGGMRAEDTVFISAASGAVGSVACQLAAAAGCRVIGTAGSDSKCAWLESEAGVASAINYKTCGNLRQALRAAAPDGIDLYFENVGGTHLEAALACMRQYGRIALCGMIDNYNDAAMDTGPANFISILAKEITVRGFLVTTYWKQYRDFLAEALPQVAAGTLKHRETVVDGLENMPEAFLGLFAGQNTGKMLVRLAEATD
jgi:NADPH-dependent curcumin reductase CurA